jgi:zinc protease
MRVRLLPLVALLVCTTAGAQRPPPGYVSEKLPNGLAVSILPDATMPVVATQVWYHVGSANEEPKTRGFAHLFEHLMFGGTLSTPKRAIWDHHERYGGDNNAYTSFDDTVYVSEIPPAGYTRVLSLEADRMIDLSLTSENLENEKRIVTEELRLTNENSPLNRLYTKGLKAIFGEHPYALEPTGTKEDVAAATLEHAREFYARFYRPKNAHLVVVGPIDAAATLAKVREAFGPLPADGETPPDVPSLATWKFPAEIDLSEDIPPVEIAVLGFPLPPTDHADAPTLKVLFSLLAWGHVDPLEEDLVRRRRKALFAGTRGMTMRRGGAIVLYSASLPYRRKASAYRFLDEARQKLGAFEWIDEAKLRAAKRRLILSELQDAYYASSIADRIGRAAWYEGDERHAFDTAARIDEVGLEDVKAAFRKYVLDREPIRVYVSPEHVPVLVRLFGWLEPVVR